MLAKLYKYHWKRFSFSKTPRVEYAFLVHSSLARIGYSLTTPVAGESHHVTSFPWNRKKAGQKKKGMTRTGLLYASH